MIDWRRYLRSGPFLLLFIVVSPFAKVSAIEVPAGKYEIIGRYQQQQNALIVYEGTEAEFRIFLLGEKTITSFLPGNKYFYKIIAHIPQRIVNNDGVAELIEVQNIVRYDPTKAQFNHRAD